MNIILLNILFSFIIGINIAYCAPRLVCYYTNWAQYRPGNGKFTPDKIDPFLCDVIIYAFGDLKNNALLTREWNDDSMISSITALKKKNLNLKVLIAVGGAQEGSSKFSTLVSDPTSRQQFIKSAVQFIKDRNLDGLDLDWEFPANGFGSRTEDKQLFTKLLSELKNEFKAYNYLLTIATSASATTASSAYEIRNISQYLDWMNLMTYDFHGSWSSFTGFNAPLYARSNELSSQRQWNVDYAVRYWVNNGFPRNKIVLGMASYGRTFTLSNPENFKPGSASSGTGQSTSYLRTNGLISYYEVCEYIKNGWTTEWDAEQMCPYVHLNNQWVTYDNVKSIILKADYIKTQNLSGGMFWALDLDDFSGLFCNQGNYPLITAAKKTFLDVSSTTPSSTTITSTAITTTIATTATTKPTTTATIVSQTTTKAPTTTTTIATQLTTKPTTTTTTTKAPTTTTTTKAPTTPTTQSTTKSPTTTTTIQTVTSTSPTYICFKGDGYYADRLSGCKAYYRCFGAQIYSFVCGDNTLFHEDLSICDWKYNVVC